MGNKNVPPTMRLCAGSREEKEVLRNKNTVPTYESTFQNEVDSGNMTSARKKSVMQAVEKVASGQQKSSKSTVLTIEGQRTRVEDDGIFVYWSAEYTLSIDLLVYDVRRNDDDSMDILCAYANTKIQNASEYYMKNVQKLVVEILESACSGIEWPAGNNPLQRLKAQAEKKVTATLSSK